MNKISYTYLLFISCFLIVILASSCKHKEDEYHTIIDKIEAKGKDFKGIETTSEAHFGDVKLIEITEDGKTFLIPDRKSQIASFKCTECHSEPLSKIKGKDYKKAHWNIKIAHANKNAMNCVTCHNSNNMDELHSITGEKIDFNKSYNLCSQCHTSQFEDWKGGAHGKRIGGWAPPRASMTCVSCHDPHKPSFETRLPVQFNSRVEKERNK
ncbi:cytochrome c3 family protein [Polaribacter sp. Hel_I_88]|uniref:cytochrome c3 family protein n=1 Tax=Polaribacter sp. Hel_I_88 TaxID=1250006 RepID=UPI00047A5A47|nr:cytochrome c3 family protein [Polaribacter sp. Hel_I_88]